VLATYIARENRARENISTDWMCSLNKVNEVLRRMYFVNCMYFDSEIHTPSLCICDMFPHLVLSEGMRYKNWMISVYQKPEINSAGFYKKKANLEIVHATYYLMYFFS
jgi:hypothetical protein